MGKWASWLCVPVSQRVPQQRREEQEERGGGRVASIPRLPGCLIACRRRTGCLKPMTRRLFVTVAKMLVLLAAAVRAVKAHEESSLETSRTSPREISPVLYLVYLRIYHCTYAGDACDRSESQS